MYSGPWSQVEWLPIPQAFVGGAVAKAVEYGINIGVVEDGPLAKERANVYTGLIKKEAAWKNGAGRARFAMRSWDF